VLDFLFQVEELRSVESVVPSATIGFGPYQLDVRAAELRKFGSRIRLQEQPFQLLLMLLERPGEVVLREEIRARLWPRGTTVEFDHSINAAVKRLRDVLSENAGNPCYIETLAKRGYRFIGQVESAPRAPSPDIIQAGAGRIETAVPPVEQGWRGAVWRPKLTIAAIAAATALLLLAIYYYRSFLPNSHLSAPVTVGLLPFENLTGDPDQEYFADGLTEETIAVLGKVNPDRMIVIARTSTMAYKRRTKTASQIGSELGADYLIEGSVRREGERVRVTVKLIRVRDQSRIWSENYDRFGSGVIQIQDELGNAIARQVQVELLPRDTNQRKQTRILDAYDPYLLGRHFWSQVTPGAIRKSIEYYQTAIAKDPSYALAFAGLADAYTILPITSDSPPREMLPLARNAASEAIRLNDSLAEAQAAGGDVDFWLEWDWGRSAERLRRAIQLDPNFALAHMRYAQLLSNSGRHTEAVAEAAKAHRLDPFSPITNTLAGQFLLYSGRYTEAVESLDKAFSIDPGFWVAHLMMGAIYERTGKPEAAIQSFEKAYSNSGGNLQALAAKGYVLARSGRRPEAEQIVHSLLETGKTRFVPPTAIALVYAGLGDRESTFQWLEKGYESRDVHMVFLTIDPMWDDFRSDPRFQGLLERCHFVLAQLPVHKPAERQRPRVGRSPELPA
jgi:TolB-like protein/DNA-binding winged helix-turn-helix (wHTH) protein/Flp pilus assembly protein TadD